MLIRAEVHKYVLIKHCHNFPLHDAFLEDSLWYDHSLVEMLKCCIGFYLNCAIAWDARVSTRFRLYIKSKWDVWYESYWMLRKA